MMANLITCIRNKLGGRLGMRRNCLTLALVSWLILLSFISFYGININITHHINTFVEQISPSSQKQIPCVSKYNGPSKAIPKTKTNVIKPELRIPFAYIDKDHNGDINEGSLDWMMHNTYTEFQNQGSCSYISPSMTLPPYGYKMTIFKQNTIPMGYFDLIYYEHLQQNANKSNIRNNSANRRKTPTGSMFTYIKLSFTNYCKHNFSIQSECSDIFRPDRFDNLHKQNAYTQLSNINTIPEYDYTDPSDTDQHSKLENKQINSENSIGYLIPRFKFLLWLFIILLLPTFVSAAPGIEDNHKNQFKVINTLNTAGQSVLLAVYQYVKPFAFHKNIKDHLIQDLGWTEARFKRKFDRTQVSTIENSPNTGEEYDISLILTCLRVLSEHYDPGNQGKWMDVNELEGRCKKIKDTRNTAFHSIFGISIPDMRNQIDNIEKLLLDILDSLKVRYPSEARVIDDMKIDINERVANILTHPLSTTEMRICRLELNMKHFKDKIPVYKNKCKDWGKVGILEFLMGSEKIHEIKTLFTEVVVEKSKFLSQNTKVKCADIFKSGTDAILLIESEAGGGKTTIFRYGISDWSNGGGVMSIDDYDLIFPMLFRNPHIKSVKELIKHLFPEASKEIDIDDIMDLITDPSLKIAFLCDGFDEKNVNSHQLFSEICELKRNYPHIRIVCTSRPESVKEFYDSVGQDHTIEHLKVRGIKESDRPAFLHRYHEEIIMAGLSKQNSKDLVDFYATQSAHHKELYRLPINLVILAWIWGLEPKQAKTIKSAAGLYTAIFDILNRKLIKRIFNGHPDVRTRLNGDEDELKRLVDSFKELVYSESLNSVTNNRIYIDDKGVKRLKNFCTDNKLPYAELIGAFLFTKVSWENIGDLNEVLEVPHKGFLDYYASMCIASQLGHDKTKFKMSMLLSSKYRRSNKIKKIILDYCHKNSQKLDMAKYQNIIQLLGSNLSLKDDNLLEKYGKDIIDLLIETGVRNNTQWFDTYSDLNVNPKAAEKFGKLIAPKLNFDNFIIKDSDVGILSVLLQHVDIQKMKVTLDISSNAIHKQLPTLYDILLKNECRLSMPSIQINDNTFDFWNKVLTQTKDINIIDATLDSNTFDSWNRVLTPSHQINLQYVTLDIINSASHNEFNSFLQVLSDSKCKVTIKNIDNEPLELWKCVLTQSNQINLENVTLDTSNVAITAAFPSLIKLLCDSKSKVTIPEIKDEHINLWNSSNAKFAKINTEKLEVTTNVINLPFLNECQKITRCKINPFWRELSGASPNMSGCDVEEMYTAVRSTSALPSTVTWLRLGLLTDASGDLVDPGIQDITTRCPGLRYLGIHLRAGSKGGPALPKLDQRVQYTYLFLSQLSQNQDHDQEWAVQVASALQPPGGFWWLVLPSCGLPLAKLLTMVEGFKTNNIKIRGGVVISSPHSAEDEATLWAALTRTLPGCFGLYWYQDDDELVRTWPELW